jgi:hypothetical protein
MMDATRDKLDATEAASDEDRGGCQPPEAGNNKSKKPRRYVLADFHFLSAVRLTVHVRGPNCSIFRFFSTIMLNFFRHTLLSNNNLE